MRRKQTRVTVWPAIADLMTAILVIAFLSGTVAMVYINNPDDQEINDTRDSINTLIFQVDSLQSANLQLQDSIKTLQDDKGKIGSVSCLGKDERDQPNSLMTIIVNPENYQIRLNQEHTESGWSELRQYIHRFDQTGLSESEMIDFARGVDMLGKERTEGSCRFFVRLEKDDEVPQDTLVLRWNKNLKDHFPGLVNPGIL